MNRITKLASLAAAAVLPITLTAAPAEAAKGWGLPSCLHTERLAGLPEADVCFKPEYTVNKKGDYIYRLRFWTKGGGVDGTKGVETKRLKIVNSSGKSLFDMRGVTLNRNQTKTISVNRQFPNNVKVIWTAKVNHALSPRSTTHTLTNPLVKSQPA